MTQYEHSLVAMKRLLDAVHEDHWANWIGTDIEQWRATGDTSHHLSAYGGMGSFNDVIICRANEHSVTEVTEAWANTLFEWLKSVCYFLAEHPTDSFTSETLANRVGRHDSSLAAAVASDILLITRDGWNWKCPHCNSDDTAVYRWVLRLENECRFEPSTDNLPLRK